MNITELVRPNIRALASYKSARDEFSGNASVWLDANENPHSSMGAWNRYPDPLQKKLKLQLAGLKQVSENRIFVGNGSDEAIDLLFRIFCHPGVDSCVIFPPTYGMYKVSAAINDVNVVSIPLTEEFQLPEPAVILLREDVKNAKLMFICSPNNPTGNLLNASHITQLVNGFQGIVIIDEAYIDFSPESTLLPLAAKTKNTVVLQTMSKAWGLAGLRLGMAFADEEIIGWMNKVKPPYNINAATQEIAARVLSNAQAKSEAVEKLIEDRNELVKSLKSQPVVKKVHPTDANFILIETDCSEHLYQYLVKQGIIIRNRTAEVPGCVRITVGTKEENTKLLAFLANFQQEEKI